MRRPKWLSAQTWADFKTQYVDENGDIPCATCGATDNMSVDHIVPRIEQGTDELANLQPMCQPCNSRKNKYPDEYWSRNFYFDRPIDLSNLRVSQRDYVYDPVYQNSEFFGQPWSIINGKILAYVQIVGAGKTLGMFSLPFALNSAVNKHAPNSPRCDRILIVTKDQQLRSQLAEELRSEPTEYGLVTEPPHVLEVKKGSDLSATGVKHDIAVMCPNILWATVDHTDLTKPAAWRPEVNDVLRQYRAIFFDEMHYANRQLSRLLSIAPNSLIFGFTASPLDQQGVPLGDIVLMAQPYGYREAAIHDQSMKEIF